MKLHSILLALNLLGIVTFLYLARGFFDLDIPFLANVCLVALALPCYGIYNSVTAISEISHGL